ncbi:MAG: mechanosensitive ion channel [Algicola sp.]|nr:mechanosensitive ion channel [Algicola sp.]
MIKFFKKIRHNLLSEGKTGKYLKYALGEIVLVVIGILIALQINNWNENRKTRKLEVQIYTELKSDLLQTRNDINEAISKHKEIFKSSQQLITDIYKKKSNSQTVYNSLTSSSAEFHIIPKTSAFENLKNIGLNTLSNDSLRIDITNLFQLNLKRLDDELGMKQADMNMTKLIQPFLFKYLTADYSQPTKYGFIHSDSITVYKLRINNYDKFLNDNELMKALQLSLYNRGKIIDEEIETVKEIDSVIYGIEEELKKLKK